MSRRGRKRKQVVREPSGRVVRHSSANLRLVALSQPHRAWLPEDKRSDQRAENLLGRLLLAEIITEQQWTAGEKWRRLMAEFHFILATPMRPVNPLARVAANDPADGPEGGDGDATSDVRVEAEEDRRNRVLRAIGDVNAELRTFGRVGPIIDALDAVILHERMVTDYALLIMGLNALARLWKIE